MPADNTLHLRLFKKAMFVTLISGLLLLLLSLYIGKAALFLMMNKDLGLVADFFFEYFTEAGNGLWWVLWIVWLFVSKKKNHFPLILAAFSILTILTQVCKQVIYPDEMRPSMLPNQHLIHYVAGVTVHSINSFPSGHTGTAFTFALLITLFEKRFIWVIMAFAGAVLVGYSRIYLGQHFPLDVGAGMVVAFVAMLAALPVQRWFERRWKK